MHCKKYIQSKGFPFSVETMGAFVGKGRSDLGRMYKNDKPRFDKYLKQANKKWDRIKP